MKTAYRIFSVLSSIVIWAVLGIAVFAVAVLFLPKAFKTEPYIVLSGSMEPVIQTGSVVYIRQADGPLKEGDIIGYMAGDMPVVHRIIGRGENGWITQGDANEIPDMNEVADGQVLGRFSIAIPKAGYLISDIRSHTMTLGRFTVPVLIPAVMGLIISLYLTQYFLGLFVLEDIKNEKENNND